MTIIAIIIVALCGLLLIGKAQERAQEIIAGAKHHDNPNWQERLAISLIPLVTKQNEKRKLRGDPVKIPAPYVDYSREGVSDRLELAFDRYRRREINIWDYKDIVTDEDRDLRYRIEDLQDSKRALPRSSEMRECYDDDIDEAREALDETKWRLDWIKKTELTGDGYYPIDEGDIAGEPEPSGSWAHFNYTTDYGTKSYREIINWEDRGFTITGYDPSVNGYRTFLKSNIENLESSSPLAPVGAIAKPVERYGKLLQGPILTEISFDYKKRGQGVEKITIANWIEYEKHIAGWDHNSGRVNAFVKKQIETLHDDAAAQLATTDTAK